MPSTFTPNKNIEQPASGSYQNAWATPVNNDWAVIDTAFGGNTAITVTSVSGTTLLTATQYQPPNIIFSGVMGSALTYEVPSGVGGIWTLYNDTTGSYPLTFAVSGGGTVVLPVGVRVLLVSDGTNLQYATTPPLLTAAVTTAETRTSDAIPTNSSYLVTYIPTAGIYKFEVNVGFTTAANAGFIANLNFSGALTGSAVVGSSISGSNSNTAQLLDAIASVSASPATPLFTVPGGSNTALQALLMTGTITAGGPGTFGFAWSQASSNAGNTTVAAGSYLTLTFVSPTA
jgi:hypothetical protein